MKFHILVFFAFVLMMIGVIVTACGPSNNPATPVVATNTPTPGNTATPTVTSTASSTVTKTATATATSTATNTPTATPTSTATSTATSTPTTTPTPLPKPFVLYSNGGFQPFGGINVFSGGGSSNPALNAVDTSASAGEPSGDTMSFQVNFGTYGGGYTGMVITTQGPTDMTAFANCTFWAKANQTASVGFNAAEANGDTSNVSEALTTTWTKFTLPVPSAGSAGQAGAIVNYFVAVLTATPGSNPLIVNFDQVSFQ